MTEADSECDDLSPTVRHGKLDFWNYTDDDIIKSVKTANQRHLTHATVAGAGVAVNFVLSRSYLHVWDDEHDSDEYIREDDNNDSNDDEGQDSDDDSNDEDAGKEAKMKAEWLSRCSL